MIYSTKKGTGLPVPNYIQLLKIDKNSYKFIWSFKWLKRLVWFAGAVKMATRLL